MVVRAICARNTCLGAARAVADVTERVRDAGEFANGVWRAGVAPASTGVSTGAVSAMLLFVGAADMT